MTFVLIPGAGGSAWYWHRVVDDLTRRGYEAIAVDLPAEDDAAGFEEYADAVVAAIAGRRRVVLGAASLGGFTAQLVCERVPVAGVVLVNAMVPRPGETAGEWWENTGSGAARRANEASAGRDPETEFDLLTAFMHDVPAEDVAAAPAHSHQQSDTPFARPWSEHGWPDIPTEVVVGRDDRMFPAAFQIEVARDRLGIEPVVIRGGHLVSLSNPGQWDRC
ncbi:MAG: alpha/beta hydrolase [Pseudonocardiales bacterium]|nr:MAG: alpha/beta hydrolase [Pseudonocardiales bacterium]